MRKYSDIFDTLVNNRPILKGENKVAKFLKPYVSLYNAKKAQDANLPKYGEMVNNAKYETQLLYAKYLEYPSSTLPSYSTDIKSNRHNTYLRAKFKKLIAGRTITEQMIINAYNAIDICAFNKQDREYWAMIYCVAVGNFNYSFMMNKKSNHRNKLEVTNVSYVEFVTLLLNDYADYTSSDRYFLGYYSKVNPAYSQEDYSRLDYLLRYLSSPDCFSDGDIDDILSIIRATPNKKTTKEDFLKVIELIVLASKK